MALILRNSFLPNMMNNMLNTGWDDNYEKTRFEPSVNIIENDDRFLMEFALPGFKKDEISIDIDNDELVIKHQNDTENSESKNYLRREFNASSFEKVFTLPETINTEAIKATMENGILTIELMKKEEAKVKPAREIKIA